MPRPQKPRALPNRSAPSYQTDRRNFLTISLFFARFLQGNISIGNIPHYRTSGCCFHKRGTEVSISFSPIFLPRFQANTGIHRLIVKTHMKIFFKKGTEFSPTFQRNGLPNHSHSIRSAARSPRRFPDFLSGFRQGSVVAETGATWQRGGGLARKIRLPARNATDVKRGVLTSRIPRSPAVPRDGTIGLSSFLVKYGQRGRPLAGSEQRPRLAQRRNTGETWRRRAQERTKSADATGYGCPDAKN